MKYVTSSTLPVGDIPYAPEGTVVYVELDSGDTPNAVSRVQSAISDRARYAGATVHCSARLLLRKESSGMVGDWIVRVVVVTPGVRDEVGSSSK